MLSEEKILESVKAYFDLFNAGDGAGIAALFADDAEVHDPVGTPPKKGRNEIDIFYKMATRAGTRLESTGPVRVAANQAAFPFRVHVKAIEAEDKAIDVDLPSGPMTIDVIDVFSFDDAGKISTMQAFWGPRNISQ